MDARDNPRIKSGDGHDGGEMTRFIGTRARDRFGQAVLSRRNS